jgi:hypothetical protein
VKTRGLTDDRGHLTKSLKLTSLRDSIQRWKQLASQFSCEGAGRARNFTLGVVCPNRGKGGEMELPDEKVEHRLDYLRMTG